MKAVCISACEVDRLGIVTPGEEVELPDALAKDGRINQHFVIDRKSIADPEAMLPDYEKSDEDRRKEFERSLQNETDWMKALDVVIDSGREVPAEILEKGRLTDGERISRLVDLWIEDFGHVFPTDMKGDGDPKGRKNKGRSGNRNRNLDGDGPKGPKGAPGDRGKPTEEADPGEGDDTGNTDGRTDDLFGGEQ